MYHPHELIHKAVGWVLREIGKRTKRPKKNFLTVNYQTMPEPCSGTLSSGWRKEDKALHAKKINSLFKMPPNKKNRMQCYNRFKNLSIFIANCKKTYFTHRHKSQITF